MWQLNDKRSVDGARVPWPRSCDTSKLWNEYERIQFLAAKQIWFVWIEWKWKSIHLIQNAATKQLHYVFKISAFFAVIFVLIFWKERRLFFFLKHKALPSTIMNTLNSVLNAYVLAPSFEWLFIWSFFHCDHKLYNCALEKEEKNRRRIIITSRNRQTSDWWRFLFRFIQICERFSAANASKMIYVS